MAGGAGDNWFGWGKGVRGGKMVKEDHYDTKGGTSRL
jgi:hypothetical protein